MKPITTAKKEVAVNYTPAMVARLHEEAPLNYEKAEKLGVELGRNARSIIAKAKREKIDYIAKEAPEPKRKGPTKKQMVATIETAMATKLIGLEKSPVKALQNLLVAIASLSVDSETQAAEIDAETSS